MGRWLVFIACIVSISVALAQEGREWDLSGYPPEVRARFEEAERAYLAEDYETALRLFNRITVEYPDLAPAHVGVAAAADHIDQQRIAVAAYRRAVELLPKDAFLRGKLADALRKSDQQKEAADSYRKAIEIARRNGEPELAAWYIGLGVIASDKGDFEEALGHYRRATELDSESVAAWHNLGVALFRLNRLDEAEEAFQTALRFNPENARTFYARGQIAQRRGELFKARDFYTRAAELDPEEPTYHYARAQMLLRLGKKEAAEESLARYRRTKALRYYRSAMPALRAGEWRSAVKDLQKAIKTDPTFLQAREDRAYAQMRLGELEAARKGFREVLEKKAKPGKTLLFLGITEGLLGNYDEAERLLLQVIAQMPHIPDGYRELANIRKARGDLEGAEAAYDLGLKEEPGWAPGYWWRGQIRELRGNLEGAEEDYRRAIALSPDQPYPKHSLAQLLAREGNDLEEARDYAEAVVATHPTPEYRATLARVYYLMNDLQAALREIEAAAREAPEDEAIAKLRRQIQAAARPSSVEEGR